MGDTALLPATSSAPSAQSPAAAAAADDDDDEDLTTAFFYGTLISPAVLRRVLFGPEHASASSTTARALPAARDALLRGFSRRRVRGADYPGMVPCAGAEVRGVLVAGLTPGDVYRLDVFEGHEYARRAVDVLVLRPPPATEGAGATPSDAPETVRALTYVWTADAAALEEREWDFDEFRREKLWRWAGDAGEAEGEYRGSSLFPRRTPFSFDGFRV
jgi:hypothetical protein